MKEFLSEYGGYIIAAVAVAILVALVIFFKDPIKTAMSSTTTKLGDVAEKQLDGATATSEAEQKALCLAKNKYKGTTAKGHAETDVFGDEAETIHYEWDATASACITKNGAVE